MSNSKERDAQKDNMLLTLILWVLLACIGMGAMLYVASRKTIVIADAVPQGTEGGAEEESDFGTVELSFQANDTQPGLIYIPLEKGIKAEQVLLENRYMERECWIYLQGVETDFYEEHSIGGDVAPIVGGTCEKQSGNVVLKLQMLDIWEYKSTMENDMLVIACHKPHELYDQIVVVDPAGGGDEHGERVGLHSEKAITLQVAKQLQKQKKSEEIKFYFTRLEDKEVSREERLAFLAAVQADLYIGICSCVDIAHPEAYGIHGFYNEEYYIPEFGNIQWADALTRNVTIAAGNRAIGLTPAKEESILYDIEIPAAEICVGYMSNQEELELLGKEAYQEKIANGMIAALEEFVTAQNMENEVKENE